MSTGAAGRVDLRRTLDHYAARHGEWRALQVPPLRYLAVDGEGDPDVTPAYAEALGALYPFAYALRAVGRAETGRDHVVPPLEGLWWADDLAAFTTRRDRSAWRWTLLILVPDWLSADHVERAREAAAVRRPTAPLDRVRLEALDEGSCVQTLHLGPYDAEGPVLADLHDRVLPERGLVETGHHHEIYLGDPRRSAPERLRTILRQPVAPAASG